MIVGTGIDLVEIARIRRLIDRFGAAFTEKVFTPAEHQEAAMRRDPGIYFAGRWAVKEAVAKALGCGIGGGCALLDVTTTNAPAGRPEITLSGHALDTLRRIGGRHLHLSVTHEANYAVASVVIEH